MSLDVEQEFGIVYIKFEAKHSNEDLEKSYGLSILSSGNKNKNKKILI